MSAESDWILLKEAVLQDLNELLSLGLTLDTARRLAGWNITYAFDNYSDLQMPGSLTATPDQDTFRNSVRLMVSRSNSRVNPGNLEGEVLDAAKLYAIFIPDVPELNILDISFSLNGVPFHHEFSIPWDYAGTAGDGSANRVTFIAGSYEIEAVLNATGGPFSITASFDVE